MTTVEATVTDPAAANAAAYLPIAAVIAPTRSTLRRVEASRVSTTAHTSRSAPTVMPRVQPSLERRRMWERRYVRRLRITDGIIVIAVTALAAGIDTIGLRATSPEVGVVMRVAAITLAAWVLLLWMFQTRSPKVLGTGATEYKRVAHATAAAFGVLAMLFVVFQWSGIRMILLVALPVGLLSLITARWGWRRWLARQREFGHYASRVIVAGTEHDVEYVIRNLAANRGLGFHVVGTTTPEADRDTIVVDGRAYPVLGRMGLVSMHARAVEADTIIVASTPPDDPDFIKRLSWDLEGTAAELILSGRLADVAGPRISLKPIDGLPLIHVEIPRFEGGAHSMKRAMDIVLSVIAMIPITLIGLFVALAIKMDDGGPVFFRQTRIGRDGREFGILKFRTMRTSAESELIALKAANEGSGPLFKMKNDPRITRVGAILRKYSLDELPQFWNVLIGDMSIVGPRPPLPSEVVGYDGRVYRRLYIKPGITGLWQVSGRSDLSWDESVRLDLRYVENWSVTNDLMIMVRTARVMIHPKGAY